jgi:hypothetical protein
MSVTGVAEAGGGVAVTEVLKAVAVLAAASAAALVPGVYTFVSFHSTSSQEPGNRTLALAASCILDAGHVMVLSGSGTALMRRSWVVGPCHRLKKVLPTFPTF